MESFSTNTQDTQVDLRLFGSMDQLVGPLFKLTKSHHRDKSQVLLLEVITEPALECRSDLKNLYNYIEHHNSQVSQYVLLCELLFRQTELTEDKTKATYYLFIKYDDTVGRSKLKTAAMGLVAHLLQSHSFVPVTHSGRGVTMHGISSKVGGNNALNFVEYEIARDESSGSTSAQDKAYFRLVKQKTDMMTEYINNFHCVKHMMFQSYYLESDVRARQELYDAEPHDENLEVMFQYAWKSAGMDQVESENPPKFKQYIKAMMMGIVRDAYEAFFMKVLKSDEANHPHPLLAFRLAAVLGLMKFGVWDPLTYDPVYAAPLIEFAFYFANTFAASREEIGTNHQTSAIICGTSGGGKSSIAQAISRYIPGYLWGEHQGEYQSPEIQKASWIYSHEIGVKKIVSNTWKELLDFMQPMKLNFKNGHPVSCTKNCPVVVMTNDDYPAVMEKLERDPLKSEHVKAIRRRLHPIRVMVAYTAAHPELQFAKNLRGYVSDQPSLLSLVNLALEKYHTIENFIPMYMNFIIAVTLNNGGPSSLPMKARPDLLRYYEHCDAAFRESFFGHYYLCTNLSLQLRTIMEIASTSPADQKIEYTVDSKLNSDTVQEVLNKHQLLYIHKLSEEVKAMKPHCDIVGIMDYAFNKLRHRSATVKTPWYLVFCYLANEPKVKAYLAQSIQMNTKSNKVYNYTYAQTLLSQAPDSEFYDEESNSATSDDDAIMEGSMSDSVSDAHSQY